MSSTNEGDRGYWDPDGRASRPPAPFRMEFWRSPLRGPWLTSFLGTILVPIVAIVVLTGLISHWAYHQEFAANTTIDPAFDIPQLFQLPASWPSWDYAASQGTHITLGLMSVPIVLAKLWSVMPRLFRWPPARDLAMALERASLLLLVGSVLVELVSGLVVVQDYYPYGFDWYLVHYYGAWVFFTMFVLHACLKLPVLRRAYRERGILRPLLDDLGHTEPEAPEADGLAPVNPAAPTISRRGFLGIVGGSSLAIFAVWAGEPIGGPLRRSALLAPWGRKFGTGPNAFPITYTAASRGVTAEMTGAGWRLTVSGARTVALSREELLAMPQSTRTLTLTCTDGWSSTQHWTGVRLAELAALVDASPGAVLTAEAVQASDPLGKATFAHSQYSVGDALLALRVNGADLSPDHGYPARVIIPGVPGEHNTKWVRELRFEQL